jgi:NitT/TauT family transport system substrate-binding protein
MTSKRSYTALGFAVAIAIAVWAGPAWSADEPVIRFGIITSGGQSEVPYAIEKAGLAQKHGIKIETVDYAVPGQQYTMFRSGAIDIAAGNFIDLLRQRKAGVGIHAIHSFMGYNNLFVTKANSAITSFTDLKGKKIGNFGTTFLDWLIVRAAGKKAYGIDLQSDANLVPGAPPLLNQLLSKGDVDAIYQFSTLTLGPIARGEQRAVVTLPELMKAAGFGPDSFYLQWIITEKWTKEHRDAVGRLEGMLREAYNVLRKDDSLWPTLAQRIRITDPALIAAYRNHSRKYNDSPYNAGLLKPTQELLDALVSIAGEHAAGVTKVDIAAFLFPTPSSMSK